MCEYPDPPILRSGPAFPGPFRTDEEKRVMMASHKGRNFGIFLGLVLVTIILFGISAATHQASCQGLSCPSGGGASASSGSNTLSDVLDGFAILGGVSSFIQLIVAIVSK
jgi:hypothetical protein